MLVEECRPESSWRNPLRGELRCLTVTRLNAMQWLLNDGGGSFWQLLVRGRGLPILMKCSDDGFIDDEWLVRRFTLTLLVNSSQIYHNKCIVLSN